MLGRLAAWAARRAWLVLLVSVAAAVAGGLLGQGLFARLGYAVFRDPEAESTRAADLARQQFGEGDPDIVALYRPRPAEVAMQAALDRVARDPQVARAMGAAGPFSQRFVSRDGKSAMAVISLSGSAREKVSALPRLRGLLEIPDTHMQLGGLVPTGRALTRLAEQSLARGERLALPIVAVLLVILFGSVTAALLPVIIGGLAVVLALGALDLLARVLPIDAFAVNVVTILGLGVAIDYALFIVSRYRDECYSCDPARALRRAVETAGRSVLFSGVTVAASLSGLLVFRQPFLRSIAVGGMVVTLLASSLALVVLPAMLALLGTRLDRGHLPWAQSGAVGFWRRLTIRVIAHRRAIVIGGTLLLLLLALPFRRLAPSRADVRALPEDEEARVVSDRLQDDFASASRSPDTLVVDLGGPAAEHLGELFDYQQRLASLPGVSGVESLLSFAGVHDRDQAEALGDRLTLAPQPKALQTVLHDRYTLVRVLPSAPPDAPISRQRVDALRALPPPPGGSVVVYGQAASLRDFTTSVRARTPWMLAWVALAMFLVLYLAFGSAVLPLKAMLMTGLSLTASFGAIVFIFQDGRLQRMLGYQSLGTTDATLPVVLFAVVFGLSMDYEVLILSRVREAYLRTGRNLDAIIEGISHTGRLVTGAAVIMVVVFSAFGAAPLVFVKALGLGMALAVALDATIVRMLLVPSTMALLGRLNWWTPLRR
jgi:RND superfamily putative drug exporter